MATKNNRIRNQRSKRYSSITFLTVLLLTFLFATNLPAQFIPSKVVKSNNIIVVDGQQFYLHEVKSGHTLFSIAKAYQVSVKAIGQENPTIQYTDIQVGQILKIPYVEILDPYDEEEKDLESFIYHIVEPKQTLLALSRKYQTPVQEIIRFNPGVETILPAGKEVRIPRTQVQPIRKSIGPPEDENFRYHQVEPKETLFSLSRKYGINVKSIKEANPDVRWGLTIGEIIKIPIDPALKGIPVDSSDQLKDLQNILMGDQEIRNEPLDTALSMTHTLLGDCQQYIRPHADTRFQIAFLLPLYVTANDTLGINDTIPRPQNDMYTDALRFLEFMEGALLAIDSLRQSGLSMDVHIFDTERSPYVVRDLVTNGSLDNMDLIIGPVYPETLEIVSIFSRLKQVPMVSPLSSRGIGVNNNPWLFQVNPTEQLQQDLASIFLSRFYDKNILLVIDPDDHNYNTSRYSSNIKNYLTYKINPGDLRYRQIFFSEEQRTIDMEDSLAFRLEDVLSLHRENLIIIPSTNKVFVSDMVNRLNNLTLHYDITLFGRPEWGNFDALQLESLYNLNLHYYTNFSNPYVNYADSLTLDVCKKFRQNFNNEPGRFSFQGFDVTYYFIKALYLFGRDLTRTVDCWPLVLEHPTLQTSFHFVREAGGGGFENQALSIVRYNQQNLMKEKISSTTVMIPE